MKQILLLVAIVALNVCTTYSQNQGYSWTFGVAPSPGPVYNSVPAMTGSTGSHPLTVLDFGNPAIVVVSDSVGLGTSCTTPINVGKYGEAPTYYQFGLVFENAPQFVDTVYTIEMTVKFDTTANYHRLIGFTELTNIIDSVSDNGIYILPDPTTSTGQVVFRVDSVNFPIGTIIADSTWYHLTFTRGANKSISYYINGVLQGNYEDSLDNFVPQASNDNDISFFIDNDLSFEEVAGSIAKLSIYNRELTESEIVTRTYNNICNTTVVLAADPNEGQQWTFPSTTPPFYSVPAVAGSADSSLLVNIGGGVITTGTSEVIGLGTSCGVAAFPTAVYPLDAGFEFDNSPRYIYDTYTIELAVKFDVINADSTKVLNFASLGGPESTHGIYINAAGDINFANGATHLINPGAAPIAAGTWYHLVFVRAANDTISYYQDSVLIGTFVDSLKQFIPIDVNGYDINFFKDDTGDEETTGEITKIGIFNAVLSQDDVAERFENICNAALVILPVNLSSFTATKSGKQVQLKWVTASEQNNLGFEVQRSSNGSNFAGIGFVNGNGTTSQQNTYYFTDQAPLAGKNYYRLKQIDIDNRVTYSDSRIINMDAERQEIQLYPNPSRSVITITNIKAGNQLSVFNAYGNLVIRKIAGGSGQEAISVDKLAAGVYMLQVTDSDNLKHTIRFTKF